MRKTKIIPIEAAKDRLSYEGTSGFLTWKTRPNKQSGDGRAGSVDAHGYRVVHIDGTSYKAHRVIWSIMTGEQPPCEIDHIDRDRGNNRWDNLRDGTNCVNQTNRPHKTAYGLGGVTIKTVRGHKYWYATHKKKHIYCGSDFFEACCRRMSAKINH